MPALSAQQRSPHHYLAPWTGGDDEEKQAHAAGQRGARRKAPQTPSRNSPRSPRARGPSRLLCLSAAFIAALALVAIVHKHNWLSSLVLGRPDFYAASGLHVALSDHALPKHNDSASAGAKAAPADGPSAAPAAACSCGTAMQLVHLPGQLMYVPMEELQRQYNASASNGRYYDIGSWRHTKPPEQQRLLFQQSGGLSGDMSFFVRNDNGVLKLGGSRWMLLGARLPDNATDMAASGEQGRRQLLMLMDEAKSMGLNTLRLLAFKDGHTFDHAIQVAPGIINEHTMHQGLDWILHQAGIRELRVVMVLTSAKQHVCERRGGAAAYVRWINPHDTLNDFYRNDTYKARFFDYMTALAVRENRYTSLQYRHDPTVLAWDLGEGLVDPGNNTGDHLQGWLPYFANFMRSKDPNHLVWLGSDGWFGPSSPHHLTTNPSLLARHPWLHSASRSLSLCVPDTHTAPLCEGTDFLRNSMPRELDLAVVSVDPDTWLSCDDMCKMEWTREWVAAHVRDALRMQKPLLVGLVSTDSAKGRSPARQLAFQRLVLDYLTTATRQGLPIAGVFLSLPSQTWCRHPGIHTLPGYNTSICHLAATAASAEPTPATLGPSTAMGLLTSTSQGVLQGRQAGQPVAGPAKATQTLSPRPDSLGSKGHMTAVRGGVGTEYENKHEGRRLHWARGLLADTPAAAAGAGAGAGGVSAQQGAGNSKVLSTVQGAIARAWEWLWGKGSRTTHDHAPQSTGVNTHADTSDKGLRSVVVAGDSETKPGVCQCAGWERAPSDSQRALQAAASVAMHTAGFSESELRAVYGFHQRAWLDAEWYRFMRGEEMVACLLRQAQVQLVEQVAQRAQVTAQSGASEATPSLAMPVKQADAFQVIDAELQASAEGLQGLLKAMPLSLE